MATREQRKQTQKAMRDRYNEGREARRLEANLKYLESKGKS